MDRSTDSPVSNGRTKTGRFGKGNSYGKGNPFAKKAHEFRQALYDAVTPDDIRVVVRRLIDQARSGDIAACRELLNRALGKPIEIDLLERLAALEEILERHRASMG